MVAAENVPVFYPTMEDMQGNMEDYIEKVEDQFAHIGICKIVPPKECTFAWHTEDIDLYSVNYLHYGRSKSWFCIAPEHRKRFECVVEGLMPDLFRKCPEFLRHKEILVSPSLLQKHNIPVHRVIQHEREFVINFPGAYHAGFNIGFNCAESTNFGTRRWVDIGRQARYCKTAAKSRETTSSTPPAKTKGRKSASAAIPLDIVATTTVADLRAVDVVIKANKIIVKKKKTKLSLQVTRQDLFQMLPVRQTMLLDLRCARHEVEF
eukprot:gene15196-17976_t